MSAPRQVSAALPFTRWALRKLVAYLRKVHGRVIRIGREALRDLLARRGVTFQRTETWKESPDPDREVRLDRIEEVLDRFPDRVFALDEFGPLGIRPTTGSCWAERKRPDRVPATYHRTHGVGYFHGCYSVGDDRLWGVNRRKKGAANTPAALKSIRAARLDGAPIYVILDNLSAHKDADIRRWAKKNKVELCFTPTYASWANPIEAHFGPLRQFTIANSNHPNHTVQTPALHAYLRWRNVNARHRDVLAAERKERARIRSEKGVRWGGRPLPPRPERPGEPMVRALASPVVSNSDGVLDWLQNWYAAQCNEDWEHEWGVKIATLDNPGWTITIDLEETDLEQHEYPRQDVNHSPHDWIWAWTSGKTFHARCGPGNLTEALALFRSWATANTP